MFATLQKRLPQELRLAGIADRSLKQVYLPDHNRCSAASPEAEGRPSRPSPATSPTSSASARSGRMTTWCRGSACRFPPTDLRTTTLRDLRDPPEAKWTAASHLTASPNHRNGSGHVIRSVSNVLDARRLRNSNFRMRSGFGKQAASGFSRSRRRIRRCCAPRG